MSVKVWSNSYHAVDIHHHAADFAHHFDGGGWNGALFGSKERYQWNMYKTFETGLGEKSGPYPQCDCVLNWFAEKREERKADELRRWYSDKDK